MNQFVLLPQHAVDELLSNQKRMLELLSSMQSLRIATSVNERKYIPESEAKDILGKGSTWFWQKRTQGELAFSKVGNRIFYRKEDIDRLFDENRQDTF